MSSSPAGAAPLLEWHGPAAFEQFSKGRRMVVPDASRFAASWSEACVDGVRIAAWATSPIAGVAHATVAAGLQLVAVSSGDVRYWTGGRSFEISAGSCHVSSASEPARFAVREPTRLLRIVIPDAVFSRYSLSTVAMPDPAPVGPVTAVLIQLAEQVLDPNIDGLICPASRTIHDLAIAAIEEVGADLVQPDELGLRHRILDHIERHLDDPLLAPGSIAADLGVSIRWVHHSFNQNGVSVARHIRDRRVDRAAELLASTARLPQTAALAARVGFSSRDQLSRAFKIRFGVTVSEYATRLAEPPGWRRGSDHGAGSYA